MSIIALKRKTQAQSNLSGKNGGFSLNNPRRIDAHTGEEKTQTSMRGLGYKGHGGCCGNFPIVLVKSQYVNCDPFVGPRKSTLNTHGMISEKYKWINRPYPYSTFQPIITDNNGYEEYNNQLKLSLLEKQKLCQGVTDASGGICNPCSQNKKTGTFVKDLQNDYNHYYNSGRYFYRKGLPLPPEKQHYPPPISNSNNVYVPVVNFTYRQFIERMQCNNNNT
jgi:hypothetical protein